MHKLSPLNIHIQDAPVVISIEEVDLGNSSNESTIYRKHQFTIIRPDLMGMASIAQIVDKKKRNDEAGLGGKMKNMLSKNKPVINLKAYIDMSVIPDFVLINPSDWGGITVKDETGSTNDIPTTGDSLISLHKFTGFINNNTMSVNFKIKDSHVK